MRALVIADIHYAKAADQRSADKVHGREGLKLLAAAFSRCPDVDAVLVLGDMIDNSRDPASTADAHAVYAALRDFGRPALVVGGNHDGPPEIAEMAYGCPDGLHAVAGVDFYLFDDTFGPYHVCARSAAAMRRFHTALAARPAAARRHPVVVLQHAPIWPEQPPDLRYPYRLQDAESVMRAYAREGVLASLAGHLHRGQAPGVVDGVFYRTLPALCEAPFSYGLLTVLNGRVSLDVLPLR